MLYTGTFDEHNGKTKLTLQAVVLKSAPEAAAALDGMEEGWSQSLDRLVEHTVSLGNGR
ncbi:MAG: SRPBCC family protein [Dehalococcoidia bacterium]